MKHRAASLQQLIFLLTHWHTFGSYH